MKMRILFEATHPAHVHCFKNVIKDLKRNGHETIVAAKDKEVTLNLLDAYLIDYEIVGTNKKGMLKKAIELLNTDYELYKLSRRFKPDVLVGRGSISLAHLSILTQKPYIALIDTENARLISHLSAPFADRICASECYQEKISKKKEMRFRGYKELAYLHPNHFKPDPAVLDMAGIRKDEKFIILRFVAWGATHDIGDKGFYDKENVVNELSKFRRVLISSETKLPDSIMKYRVIAPPEMMHSLLYYADLFIGESATMATESAVLGTPSIFVSSSRRGYTDELEEKYDLLYNFTDSPESQQKAISKAMEILMDKSSDVKWNTKRETFLKDKEDVAAFMLNQILKYER
jgi:predicted glycosyltransferase